MTTDSAHNQCNSCKFTCMHGIYTPHEFDTIEKNKTEIVYSRGETIIKQNSYISHVLFLKKGLIKMTVESAHGKKTNFKIIKGGNYIDLSLLGDHLTYPFSIVSITDVTVCQIRKETIQSIMQTNKKATKYLIKWFSEDYTRMYKKIADLSHLNNHGKICSMLLELDNIKYNGLNLYEFLSRKDLAEYSTVSIDRLNKILLELKHDKIISYTNNSLDILEPEIVKRLSKAG